MRHGEEVVRHGEVVRQGEVVRHGEEVVRHGEVGPVLYWPHGLPTVSGVRLGRVVPML